MKMKLLAPAATFLALLGAVSGALGLHELGRGGKPGQPSLILRFDRSEDEQAKAAVRTASAHTHDFTQAKALTQSALSQNPYNTDARLRLVFIDMMEHNGPTPEGLRHLRQSYDLAPYDPESASWRTKFVLEFWDVMPLEIRRSAIAEASAFNKVGSRVANMAPTLGSIANQNGATVAAAILQGHPTDAASAPVSDRPSTIVVQ